MLERVNAHLVRTGLLPLRHDIALLRRESTEDERSAPAPLRMRTITLDEATVRGVHELLGHRISHEVLGRRLRHSIRFVVFDDQHVPVASAWLVARERYVDELGWLFGFGRDEVWLRDVFVKPALRGRRVFASMVSTLLSGSGGGCVRLWSDLDWGNAPSMKAHRAAGFEVVARRRAWRWCSTVMRGSPPVWPLPIAEIDAGSSWLRLTGAVLQRHRSLLA